MNNAQEDTDDMEWEEVGREEKLERARRKKEGWELVRFAKGIVLELGEKAVTRAENKHVSECLEYIVLEGWRRIETGRALRSINNLEKEVQNRIVEYCVQMRTEEISLMTEEAGKKESPENDPW